MFALPVASSTQPDNAALRGCRQTRIADHGPFRMYHDRPNHFNLTRRNGRRIGMRNTPVPTKSGSPNRLLASAKFNYLHPTRAKQNGQPHNYRTASTGSRTRQTLPLFLRGSTSRTEDK